MQSRKCVVGNRPKSVRFPAETLCDTPPIRVTKNHHVNIVVSIATLYYQSFAVVLPLPPYCRHSFSDYCCACDCQSICVPLEWLFLQTAVRSTDCCDARIHTENAWVYHHAYEHPIPARHVDWPVTRPPRQSRVLRPPAWWTSARRYDHPVRFDKRRVVVVDDDDVETSAYFDCGVVVASPCAYRKKRKQQPHPSRVFAGRDPILDPSKPVTRDIRCD